MHAEEADSARATDGVAREGDNILMPEVLFQVATSVLLPRQRRHRVPDSAIRSILSGAPRASPPDSSHRCITVELEAMFTSYFLNSELMLRDFLATSALYCVTQVA